MLRNKMAVVETLFRAVCFMTTNHWSLTSEILQGDHKYVYKSCTIGTVYAKQQIQNSDKAYFDIVSNEGEL
jgi:hypothetical protein